MKEKRLGRNVRARARMAAKKGRPYVPSAAGFQKLASQAHAAEVLAMAAIEKSEAAQETADEARQEAVAASSTAGDAMTEAVEAKHTSEASQRLSEVTSERLNNMEKELKEGKEAWTKTEALGKHNEQRLNVDDRRKGYSTPKRYGR